MKKLKKKKDRKQNLRLFRSSEPLKSVLMWGINHSMAQLKHIEPRLMLFAEDFKSFVKIKIHNHKFNKENMPEHFTVKEYCPMVFHYLRQRFQVDSSIMLKSFISDEPLWSHPNNTTESKYLVSYNKLFFIKIICPEEVSEMHKVLYSYHEYLVSNSFKTLLPQYLAMYRITVGELDKHILIMRNLYSPRITLKYMFDLKGCTIDRGTADVERTRSSIVLKDNDFLTMNMKIYLGSKKTDFMSLLSSDVDFLQSRHLMGYSLLVGIAEYAEKDSNNGEDIDSSSDEVSGAGRSPFSGQCHKILEWSAYKGSDGQSVFVYFLGVIDMLTKYNVKKMTAQTYKTMLHLNSNDFTTLKPDSYAKRFLSFIDSVIV